MPLLDRYRTLPRSQRILWVVGPLAILAGILLAVWFGLSATVGKPVWSNLGYEVRDARHTLVTYQVTRPSDRTVTCSVFAKELSHGTVGRVDDVIPPGGDSHVVRTVEVRTTARAVMGEVGQCRLDEQP